MRRGLQKRGWIKMNQTEQVLRSLIGASLFGLPAEYPADADWNAVLAEAQAQTVVSLVGNCVPEAYRGAWKIPIEQNKAHFMRALYEQTNLTALLRGAEIPFVILKGTAAAIYYPTPANRTMGDVDILVSDGFFDAAFSLLSANGYTFEQDYGDGRDYSFEKDGVIFELHRRYSDEGHDIEPYLREGIDHARTHTLYGFSFPALPKAANGLVLLDHIRHHLFGGLGLRQILDFMMFVASEPDEKVFERDFLPLFEEAKLGTLAKVIAKTCKRYFGLPVSAAWCETADDKTCEELLETVFSSGNFGRKDPYEYRPMQSFTMGVKKEGFFRTLQKAGVANCKAFQKHRILRPFAWLYQLFRYLGRGIAALFRREKLIADISSGKEKADFFRRLGIE